MHNEVEYYNISKKIFAELENNSLESKIIKTLTLIYCLNQFERLAPTNELLHDIYSDTGYSFEIKNTILEFENDIVTNKYYLNEDGSLITGKSINQIPRLLDVTKELITEAKTIILDASDINSVKLKTLGYEYLFDLSEAPILALWTYPGYGDYLCVEPWWGIPDIINPNPELKDKPMMRSLNPNESEEVGYSITIIR